MDREAIQSEKLSLLKGSHAVARVVTGRGYVRLNDSHLRLVRDPVFSDDETVLAEAPWSEVTYWEPKLLMGDGVKVGFGSDGDWTVEPANNTLFAIKHDKEWTAMFIEALVEAGVAPKK